MGLIALVYTTSQDRRLKFVIPWPISCSRRPCDTPRALQHVRRTCRDFQNSGATGRLVATTPGLRLSGSGRSAVCAAASVSRPDALESGDPSTRYSAPQAGIRMVDNGGQILCSPPAQRSQEIEFSYALVI